MRESQSISETPYRKKLWCLSALMFSAKDTDLPIIDLLRPHRHNRPALLGFDHPRGRRMPVSWERLKRRVYRDPPEPYAISHGTAPTRAGMPDRLGRIIAGALPGVHGLWREEDIASQAVPAASHCRAHRHQARRTGFTCSTGSPAKTSEIDTMDADRNRQLVRC